MKPHPIQEATSIFIITLGLCLFVHLLMESMAFLIVVMSLVFIAMIVALYEYNKGKL
jgi:hypothetical protein